MLERADVAVADPVARAQEDAVGRERRVARMRLVDVHGQAPQELVAAGLATG